MRRPSLLKEGKQMQITITPAQFAALDQKISGQSSIRLAPINATSGIMTTPDVTLSYSYDGVSTLDVEVTAKNSWKAKLASDSIINGQIMAMFQKYIG